MKTTHRALSVVMLSALTLPAEAVVIIDGTTPGFYNDSLGTVLNGTSNLFPTSSDPIINDAPEPDLSPAAAILGGWLSDPPELNGNWSGPDSIPAFWPVGTETAIVYRIEAGGGLENVKIDIGVDNGAFAWLDGVYLGGHLRPGGVALGELSFEVPAIGGGVHHLQVLREDHGSTDGYAIRVTAEVVAELVGDLNGDGFVGAGDLDILLGQWNQTVPPFAVPDLTGDGFIGAGDLDVLLGNWNAGVPLTEGAAAPEPGAAAVLGLGGLALGRRRWRVASMDRGSVGR